jgi:adenylate kinase family enzyme
MKFENVYFFNGTAYAGKSTMVKRLAEKYGGIACEENYHDALLDELDKEECPGLCYTRDLQDWHDFVRRTPDEYEAWINRTSKECEILELQILSELVKEGKPIFVDTNISLETLKQISDREHVLIMLADPEISVNLFFNRPDKEKQFLYRLIMEEPNPEAALHNFRQCLSRINCRENYDKFLNSGFRMLLRDENRSVEETLRLAEIKLGLDQ